MEKFWELFAQSVIMQALLALIMVSVICYLAVMGQPIPDVLVNGTMLILGFFFGAKSAQTQAWLGRTYHKGG